MDCSKKIWKSFKIPKGSKIEGDKNSENLQNAQKLGVSGEIVGFADRKKSRVFLKFRLWQTCRRRRLKRQSFSKRSKLRFLRKTMGFSKEILKPLKTLQVAILQLYVTEVVKILKNFKNWGFS